MTGSNKDLLQSVLNMTIKDALATLADGLTPAEMDAVTTLEKRIDKSAYRHDEETGSAFASRDEHRQVALAALSLAIDAMLNGRCPSVETQPN